jgi:hypothetical protein
MIAIWEEVLKTASEFPEEDQKILATCWLREMKTPDFIETIIDEIKWEKSFSESQDILEMMADKALGEVREGKAEQVGWDEL